MGALRGADRDRRRTGHGEGGEPLATLGFETAVREQPEHTEIAATPYFIREPIALELKARPLRAAFTRP